jgi:DNA polymerase III sliding clamp (beta) subunit (PCNA family)
VSKKAVFEVPTLADAISKANRVAPTKGASLDRAAGIVIEVDPYNVNEPVLVKATDLEVTIRQHVNVLEMGDEAVTWRLPASLLHGIMSTLPMGSGNHVKLWDTGDSNVYFQCGKTKAKLRQIGGDYPAIPAFDPALLVPAANLAQRLAQVAWACDGRGSGGVLSGVHMDGDFLFACDRASLAMVPCVVPVDRPVTAPLSDISAIIKNTSEVSIRASDRRLELMPDPYTQASSILFVEEYPNVKGLIRDTHTHELTVNSAAMLATLERTLVLVKSERLPTTTITIGDAFLKMEMDVPEVGKVVDEIEVIGGSTGEPFVMAFSPQTLKESLHASGRPTVTIQYGPDALSPVKLKDDAGFFSLLMPRKVSS